MNRIEHHYLICDYYMIYIWKYYPLHYRSLCEFCFDKLHEETRGFRKTYSMISRYEKLADQEFQNKRSELMHSIIHVTYVTNY